MWRGQEMKKVFMQIQQQYKDLNAGVCPEYSINNSKDANVGRVKWVETK